MSNFTRARRLAHPSNPAFLRAAVEVYGAAFDPHQTDDLGTAMAEWSELDSAERSFTLAHLLYLQLVAQARTERLFVRVSDLLEEVAEDVHDAVEDLVIPDDALEVVPDDEPDANGLPIAGEVEPPAFELSEDDNTPEAVPPDPPPPVVLLDAVVDDDPGTDEVDPAEVTHG